MRRDGKPANWWNDKAPLVMAALFVVVFYALISRQYLTFNTRAADLDRFSQAIWNTLHGRFLFSTIENRSILGGHFSPFLALLSPLLLIWEDVRILSLVQTIGLAATGLILARIVREKHPTIAPWFLLAFYLNPALHEIALLELRRITFAMPFLALALYALSVQRRWLMALALFIALLCKENVAIVVIMVGGYLFVFERDRKWGSLLMVLGVAWIAMVLLWINPALDPRAAKTEAGADAYRGLRYFTYWGNSLPQIALNVAGKPMEMMQRMFDPDGLKALWRIFLPLGLVLPLLSPAWFLLAIPSMAYMLLSGYPPMHRLEDWYMASILPTLFAAIGVVLTKRPLRQARWAAALLLGSTIIGFLLFSQAPLGGKFKSYQYDLTEHHLRAAEVIADIPQDARVAALSAFTPHLTFREHIYVYPWIAIDRKDIDYFLFDRQLNSYPMGDQERNDEINNLIADPGYVVETEVDGIYLIRNDGEQLPSISIDRVAEAVIRLDRIEVALADDRDFYQTEYREPIAVHPGQNLRVTLYWEALGSPEAERTVSVRVTDAGGTVVAQHDMKPSNGARPTSWWQAGWKIRDVYYLTLPTETMPGAATLDVLLYDSYTQERVSFDGGDPFLTLAQLTVVPR